jgi:hypothetical protein
MGRRGTCTDRTPPNLKPIIPLRNESLFESCGPKDVVAALSAYYDVAREILDIDDVEKGILQKTTVVKFAEMNFLERSASRRGKKMPAFGGSVGVQLFEFLANIRKILEQWLNDSGSSNGVNQNAVFLVREVVELWKDLVQLSSTTNLNESVFHVYLALFEIWIRNAEKEMPKPYVQAAEMALRKFREPLKLVTGLSMEQMWAVIGPSVPKSLPAWDQYLALKAIMARFDKVGVEGGEFTALLFWKTEYKWWMLTAAIGNLDTVLKLKESLVQTATAVLADSVDVSSLVQELDASILPAGSEKTTGLPGTFEAIFDLLLKFKMLQNGCQLPLTPDNLRMAHFAGRATADLVGYELPGVEVKTAFERVVADMWTYPAAADRGPNALLTGKIAAEMLRTRFVRPPPTLVSCLLTFFFSAVLLGRRSYHGCKNWRLRSRSCPSSLLCIHPRLRVTGFSSSTFCCGPRSSR